MTPINLRVLLTGAATLLVLSACNQEPSTTAAPAVKEVAEASVNGITIGKSRVDMIVKQGAESGQPAGEDPRKSIIDRLIMQTVIAEEAIKKGLDKSPEVIEQLDVIRQTVLANAYVADYIKNNPISADALKSEYERIKATITGDEYHAHHILVATQAEAKAIIAKLKKDPGAFEKLAMEKSTDASTKTSGGDLGWLDMSRLPAEFGAAVVALAKGAISQEPTQTQFGYHVIRLDDAKPIEAPPLDEVKDDVTRSLQQQNLKKQLDDLKSQARIEVAGVPIAPTAPAAAASATP